MRSNAATAYQNQQIMTASPAMLVTLLYERAIRALSEAVRAAEQGDIQGRFNHTQRAGDIITHLWSTLDETRGGEIATNLGELYRFMLRRLGDLNVRNDLQAARDVIGLLEPLAESWRQIAAQGGPAGAASRPAAMPAVGGANAGTLALSA